ncbi:hypothetical protein [Candidatus Enterococcus huntleyi]|uniref:hypothetical protein n=1 Tax=Candidatus Enterococcus huntleyi TaxID=1857217 RepID=UPI001F25B20C|nr:hypothetical protein [Enterococcus sp. JM4C]
MALRKRYIKDNPCTHLRELKTEAKKMEFWTVQKFMKFKALFHADELNFLLFFTGMRSGELSGLT